MSAMNLPEALAREIARVRGLLGTYEQVARLRQVSPMIAVTINAMRTEIEAACRAAGSGDIAEMMRAVESLKEWEK